MSPVLFSLLGVGIGLTALLQTELGRLGCWITKRAEGMWLPPDAAHGWSDNAYSAYEDAAASRRSHVGVFVTSLYLIAVYGPYVGVRRTLRIDPRARAVAIVGCGLAVAGVLGFVIGPRCVVAELRMRTERDELAAWEQLTKLEDLDQGEAAHAHKIALESPFTNATGRPVTSMTDEEWDRFRTTVSFHYDDLDAERELARQGSHILRSITVSYLLMGWNGLVGSIMFVAALGAPSVVQRRRRRVVGFVSSVAPIPFAALSLLGVPIREAGMGWMMVAAAVIIPFQVAASLRRLSCEPEADVRIALS